MFKKLLINKKYIRYGSAIIISKGLEYFILFFAASFLAKEVYGELEYYKKIIEVGSSIFAFGFPALIMSYTKSKNSKIYFYVLSLLFVVGLTLFAIPIFYVTNTLFLSIPFLFYALFFAGGITPIYILVHKDSKKAAYYKIILALLFYSTLFILLKYFNVTAKAFVVVTYILLPIFSIWAIVEISKQQIVITKLIKYWSLLKKLLLKSFSLVVSNFANLMFLYTDIFIIKILANNANKAIADYSFALNVANMLMLIALTLVQVDIEKLKQNKLYVYVLGKKIAVLTFIAAVFLVVFYKVLISTYFIKFNNTFLLFLILLIAKIFHNISTLYGTNIVIYKAFKANLVINLAMLLLNIVFSYILFAKYGIFGVAIASLISLFIRLVILYKLNSRLVSSKLN